MLIYEKPKNKKITNDIVKGNLPLYNFLLLRVWVSCSNLLLKQKMIH